MIGGYSKFYLTLGNIMTTNEKTLARILFENKIRKLEGNAFEDFFTQIMNYADPEFEQIKPWGNIGDRKNDGFNRSKGIYYQVYAPENIANNYPETVAKIETDFKGLLAIWQPINEFYFVVNEKYKGVNADANLKIEKIVKVHSLTKGKIITAKDLEKIVFDLDDDIIVKIVGFLPNIDNITNLDFSVLNQVIAHIMKIRVNLKAGEIKFPDWGEKIQFNKLSTVTKNYLDNGSFNFGALNEFLANENFLAEELQKHLTGLYQKIKLTTDVSEENSGDKIFWDIVNECLPNKENVYISSVITIMAKYFESCDIFEEPLKA